MRPDIKIRDYYFQFIKDAEDDINEYNEKLSLNKLIEEETYNYITKYKKEIDDIFNINLDDFIEYKTKQYNSSETLYNIVIKLLKKIENHPNKIHILQVIKYCNILRNKNKYNELIKSANTRKNIEYKDYRSILQKYYIKVQQCVLEGYGYKFKHGIGVYCCIQRKTIDKNDKKKLDFAETRKRKKEIIEKGLTPYDSKEAEWYKSKGIPYDGIDYRVYKNNSHYYDFCFIKSRLSKKSYKYERSEYLATKYRGMSYKEIADTVCKNLDDIYNLQVDIRYKLNILLYKYPNKYLNFIRNVN